MDWAPTHTDGAAMCLGVSTSHPSWRVVVGWRRLLDLVVGQVADLFPNGACSLGLAQILCCVAVLSHVSVLSCVGCVVSVVAFHACPSCTYPVPCNPCFVQLAAGSGQLAAMLLSDSGPRPGPHHVLMTLAARETRPSTSANELRHRAGVANAHRRNHHRGPRI